MVGAGRRQWAHEPERQGRRAGIILLGTPQRQRGCWGGEGAERASLGVLFGALWGVVETNHVGHGAPMLPRPPAQ